MNETINYMFGKLRSTEVVIQKVAKELKQQKSFNRNIALITGILAYYTIVSGIEQRKQAGKIKKLEREIKELTGSEGE